VGGAAGGILIAHVPGSAGYASLSWLSVPMLLAAIGLSLLFSASRLNVARLGRLQ
jgi:hypothetical protein